MSDHFYPVVYIDSDVEQAAWLFATFGPEGAWQTMSQTMRMDDSGRVQEVLEIRLATGDSINVPFMEVSPDDSLEGEGIDRTAVVEDIMHRAAQFAEANPPHHPGSLPRFPVPARSYKDAVAVPMAILAVDNSGMRGLYSPPRYVVLSVIDESLVGIGDFPGFDPEMWPPARVGDWPPATSASMPEQQMQGVIQRFSCCWSRVLEAWFAGDRSYTDVLKADIKESLRYRAMLDAPGFDDKYAQINPEFQKWLEGAGT